MPRPTTHYSDQDRGSDADYTAYFAGMNKSMAQKVGLAAAHFPARGKIADFGCGSGQGTFDLASLYPELTLVGVDINPVTVEACQTRYHRPNLEFVVGDVAQKVFTERSLDGIQHSSTGHHLTSFNDFDVAQIGRCLDAMWSQLRYGAAIAFRDFVIPPNGQSRVHLSLPANNGASTGEPAVLSTAALFERFCRDFRSSLNRHGPAALQPLDATRPGWRRYATTLRLANEFVLRKDYREHWEVELQEEYTYYGQKQFELEFARRGFRIVASVEIHNPWIVENRYRGKFEISETNGTVIDLRATNYSIIGEKVRRDESVRLIETERTRLSSPAFLELTGYRDRRTGRVMELVSRPGRSVDFEPWFRHGTRVFVVAKRGFPRPLVNASHGSPNLDRAGNAGYITEPVSALLRPGKDVTECASELLRERAQVDPDRILAFGETRRYFPSPGGLDERVLALPIELRADFAECAVDTNYSDLSTAGSTRPIDAHQILRAAQVGGLFDTRLELNTYELLLGLGEGCGPWVGAPIRIEAELPRNASVIDIDDLTDAPDKDVAAFERCELYASRFLTLWRGRFEELTADGGVAGSCHREYVLPTTLSANTISVLPAALRSDGVHVGVELRQLSAVQSVKPSALLETTPAWRLPTEMATLKTAEEFVRTRLQQDFGVQCQRLWSLGGKYYPSIGATPEVVYPMVAEVDGPRQGHSPLRWVRLDTLIEQRTRLEDAHLLVSLFRLAVATGVVR